MKRIFGEINISWKRLIISAIVIGVVVGLLNSIPVLKDTSFTDPAIYFDLWILFGILIIMNSKSNKESALKCFVFFLISQPLIYLVEVPFSQMGWQLFIYYKYWFYWTIFCLPMGYIGYYIKKDKWWGLIILFPMLLLLGYGILTHVNNLMFSFPKHILSYLFCAGTIIIYPLCLFNNKKIRVVGTVISISLVIMFTIMALTNKSTYETEILCNGGKYDFDEHVQVSLKDSEYGEVYLKEIPSIDAYCVHAVFKKSGHTELNMKYSDGTIKTFDLVIEKNTYDIEEIK